MESFHHSIQQLKSRVESGDYNSLESNLELECVRLSTLAAYTGNYSPVCLAKEGFYCTNGQVKCFSCGANFTNSTDSISVQSLISCHQLSTDCHFMRGIRGNITNNDNNGNTGAATRESPGIGAPQIDHNSQMIGLQIEEICSFDSGYYNSNRSSFATPLRSSRYTINRNYFSYCQNSYSQERATNNIDEQSRTNLSLFRTGNYASSVNRPTRLYPFISVHNDTTIKTFPDYKDARTRQSSFSNWQRGQATFDLAEAGFFYIGYEDRVQCFSCGVVLCNWEPSDIPWIEHAKHSPQCKFVKQFMPHSYQRPTQVQVTEDSNQAECAVASPDDNIQNQLDFENRQFGSTQTIGTEDIGNIDRNKSLISRRTCFPNLWCYIFITPHDKIA